MTDNSKKLTRKQQIFIDEYLKDLNATQAAIRAGYSVRTANEIGARLLANVSIRNLIDEKIKARSKETALTQERVIQEISRLVMFDPRKVYDSEGRLIPIHKLDSDTAACISSIELNNLGQVKKIKFWDKGKQLELAGRHLGMFDDKLKVAGGVTIQFGAEEAGL